MLRWSGFLLLLTGMAGCSSSSSVCETENDCETGFVCRGTTCVPLCNTDGDCEPFETCDSGACVEVILPSCRSDAECTTPGVCQQADGTICRAGECVYGTRPAGLNCDEGNMCIPAATCDGNGECTGLEVTCDQPPDSECILTNTVIRTFAASGTCEPSTGDCVYATTDTPCASCALNCAPCSDDSECAGEGYCDNDGTCSPDLTQGEICERSEQCAGTTCECGDTLCSQRRCTAVVCGPCDFSSDGSSCDGQRLDGGCRPALCSGFGAALLNGVNVNGMDEAELAGIGPRSLESLGISTSALLGYWKLDGTVGALGAGVTITDFSPAGRDGTTVTGASATSMAYSSGKVDEAVTFDGDDDRIEIPSDATLEGLTAITMMAWVRPVGSPEPGGSRIFHKANGTLGDSYGLLYSDGARPQFRINTGTLNILTADSQIRADTGWYHVAGTWDGSTMRVYVNGREIASQGLVGTLAPSTGVLSLGGHADDVSGDRFLDGDMDEASIWSRALSSQELRQIYAAQIPRFVGQLTSAVCDAGSNTTWETVVVIPDQPYGKALTATGDVGYPDSNLTANGLTALYPMDGTAGSILEGASIAELTGNQTAGTARNGDGLGMAHVPGLFGPAVDLDGVDDSIEMAPWFEPATTDFTVAGWVYALTRDATNLEGGIVSQEPGTGTGRVWLLSGPGDFATSVLGGLPTFGNMERILPHRWSHLAVSRQDLTLTIYVNGAPAGTISRATEASDGSMLLGRHIAAARFLGGTLDDWSAWTRALTLAEIERMNARGRQRWELRVRTCSMSDCSDGTFVGPDGTPNTFYSEASNGSSGVPAFDVSALPSARYFQYRLNLTTEEASLIPRIADVEIYDSP